MQGEIIFDLPGEKIIYEVLLSKTSVEVLLKSMTTRSVGL